MRTRKALEEMLSKVKEPTAFCVCEKHTSYMKTDNKAIRNPGYPYLLKHFSVTEY